MEEVGDKVKQKQEIRSLRQQGGNYVSSISRLKTFGHNNGKKFCKTNAKSVANNLRPQSITCVISTPNIQHVSGNIAESVTNNSKSKLTSTTISRPITQYESEQCEVVSNPRPESPNNNSYKKKCARNILKTQQTLSIIQRKTIQDEGSRCVQSVRNDLSPKTTAKVISNLNTQHEASQCEPPKDKISSKVKNKPSNQSQEHPDDILQYDGGDTSSECSDSNSLHNLKKKAPTQIHNDCFLRDASTLSQPNNLSHKLYRRIPYALMCDGADTASEFSEDCHSEQDLNSDSEEEIDSVPIRATLVPTAQQGPSGAPLQLEVDSTGTAQAPRCIPLCVVTNPRCME
jgi:hypothetical protein